MLLKAIFLLACASPVFSDWSQSWSTDGSFHVAPSESPFSSLDNNVNFFFQYDGNFVVYLHGTTNLPDAAWSSQTGGRDCTSIACELIFQNDGNLVVYHNGVAVWDTATTGRGDSMTISSAPPYVKVQDALYEDIWTATRECAGTECNPS